jgi:hypothetical protein
MNTPDGYSRDTFRVTLMQHMAPNILRIASTYSNKSHYSNFYITASAAQPPEVQSLIPVLGGNMRDPAVNADMDRFPDFVALNPRCVRREGKLGWSARPMRMPDSDQ